MGLFTNLKANKALLMQNKGQVQEASKLFEECIAEGLQSARYLLAYSVLLIKESRFERAKEMILRAEKAKDITAEQKRQVYINYAICLFKLGEQDKAIKLLEKEHVKNSTGLLQQTLGYFYIENNDFDKAFDFITESLEYDSEDAIVLDNMGQYYYRKSNPDKIKAKEYFDKAIQIRPSQIDTLYFLALYDLEAENKSAAQEKLETALEGNFTPLNFAQREMVKNLLETIEK